MLLCYTVILKLHIIDSKKEAYVSGNLEICPYYNATNQPHSSSLNLSRAKSSKFPIIPYIGDLSYVHLCAWICVYSTSYINTCMHNTHLHACHMYIHAHTCSDGGKWQNQVGLMY